MAAPNRTTFLILGLLAQGPKSGYEIKQVVEKTISHFWKESYGHLYPTLGKLMADGLVRRVVDGSSRTQERQRYALTDAGHASLQDWLAAPIEVEGVRNELALKLYFGRAAPVAVSRAHLEAHRAHHLRRLEHYAAEQPELEVHAAEGHAEAVYELITLSLGVHVSSARVAWCDEALRRLALLEAPQTESGA